MLATLVLFLLFPALLLLALLGVSVIRHQRLARESQAQHRALFAENPEVMLIYDPASLRILDVNQSFVDIYGYTRAEALSLSLEDLRPADELPRLKAHIDQLDTARRDRHGALWRHKTKAGEARTVEVSACGIDVGQTPARLVVIRDMTALLRSEQSYRAIFNAVADTVFLHDLESGVVLDVNARVEALLGYRPDEIIGTMTVGDLSLGEAPYDGSTAERWIRRAVDAGAQCFEWQCRHRDGSSLWAEVVLEVIDLGGQQRVMAAVRDISARKRAEAERARYAERLRRLREIDLAIATSHSVDEVANTAVNGVRELVGCDRVVVTLLDRPRQQMVLFAVAQQPGVATPRLTSNVIPIADFGEIAACEAGRVDRIDDLTQVADLAPARQRLRDAGLRSVVLLPLMVDGELVGTLNLADRQPGRFSERDIEMTRGAVVSLGICLQSARLRESVASQARRLAQFRNIEHAVLSAQSLDEVAQITVDHIQSWLGVLRVSFARIDVPAQELEILALAVAASTDMPAGYRTPLNEYEVLGCLKEGRAYINNDLEHAERTVMEARLYAEGARALAVFPLRLDAELYGALNLACATPGRFDEAVVSQLGDAVSGLTIALRHSVMSERIQRHAEELEARVDARTAELSQAMRQLVQSEKLASLGSLVAGVAHELNTPLGSAVTVASTLSEWVEAMGKSFETGSITRSELEAFVDDARNATALLNRSLTRAGSLVSSFKQVAVDQASSRRRHFALRAVVDEICAALKPLLREGGHDITVDMPPDLALESYPGPLEQVITNLVGNSITHGFAGRTRGRIVVSAEALSDASLCLSYTDDGHGIAPALLDRVFDPFFTTRMGEGGSGLGLYIVFNLVTGVLGGTVSIQSAPGDGVRVEMRLPRVAPDPVAGEPLPPSVA
ncbi:MAG: PAS domain S-box protein [Denitromonas halophila]|nr:MAG: PAS domain S-box protein [Denitromonas halophila]TVT71707.1 MAG: PAS domain S-box protein [Denitromonas halophila]